MVPAQARPEALATTSSRDATPRQPAPRAAERGRKPAPVVLLGVHQTGEKAEVAMGRLREALGPEVGARLLLDGKAPRLRILLSDTEPQARCEELKARGVACSFLYPAADGSLR